MQLMFVGPHCCAQSAVGEAIIHALRADRPLVGGRPEGGGVYYSSKKNLLLLCLCWSSESAH